MKFDRLRVDLLVLHVLFSPRNISREFLEHVSKFCYISCLCHIRKQITGFICIRVPDMIGAGCPRQFGFSCLTGGLNLRDHNSNIVLLPSRTKYIHKFYIKKYPHY